MISDPYKSKDTVLTTSATPLINLVTSISVNLNEGSSIRSVTSTVLDPGGDILGSFNMLDNGTSGDTTAGDGKYTTTINISNIECLLVGGYTIQFIAENNSGLFSNLIISGLDVVNTDNLPTVVSNVHMPDSLLRPNSDLNFAVVSSYAIDSNGVCDLKGVFFTSIRPDGQPGNNGNPIFLFDDGNISVHGDTIAGDNRYSNKIAVSPTNLIGYYKFTYKAEDRSNILSNEIVDSILVYSP